MLLLLLTTVGCASVVRSAGIARLLLLLAALRCGVLRCAWLLLLLLWLLRLRSMLLLLLLLRVWVRLLLLLLPTS
jgi:hypothetical protein